MYFNLQHIPKKSLSGCILVVQSKWKIKQILKSFQTDDVNSRKDESVQDQYPWKAPVSFNSSLSSMSECLLSIIRRKWKRRGDALLLLGHSMCWNKEKAQHQQKTCLTTWWDRTQKDSNPQKVSQVKYFTIKCESNVLASRWVGSPKTPQM